MPSAGPQDVSIVELLTAINQRYSEQLAVRIKEGDHFRALSYRQLGQRTADTAHGLKQLGVLKGDRVAILSESRPEWVVAFFGSISCGGIVVPLDIKLSEAEISFILKDSAASTLVVSAKLLEKGLRVKPSLPALEHLICLDDVGPPDVDRLDSFRRPGEALAPSDVNSEDTALIVYTSGTTGVAKGVELTFANLLFEAMSIQQYNRLSPDDRFLSILPLNHMLELTGGLIGPLYAGASITYCDSLKPPVIMRLLQETQTTVMVCVPLVLKMLHSAILKHVEDLAPVQRGLFGRLLGLSKFLLNFNVRIGKLFFPALHKQFGGHLRCFVSGGAPLDPAVEEDMNAMGFAVLQGYGLTETSPVVTVNTFAERKYASVGIPLKGVDVRILKAKPEDRDGEVIVRGPNVMRGYANQPEKTAEVLKDGWFHTGDIGYLDEDGFLYLTGRIKNMIVLGAGKKVFPEEVEEVLSQSPLIKELCVLGRKAAAGLKAGTEEVVAVVVPNLDALPDADRTDHARLRATIAAEINRLSVSLADYKRITDFMLWNEELPKTSTKKVLRPQVKELAARWPESGRPTGNS
jgi:long-chain acyl-CoA synthetase